MIWGWVPRNLDVIVDALAEHLWLSLIPVVIGLVISIPLGWLANRSTAARAVLIPSAGVLYTVPSLVLFIVLPGILGTKILDPVNVVVALAIYTVALLVRSVADALAAVPDTVIAAATAMGFRPLRRFLTVEFPLSVPVLVAGLRVATVSNISLVSIGALVGFGGLGQLFTDGYQADNPTEIVTGIALSLVLALAADAVLLSLGKLVTPWETAQHRPKARTA
ncbi:ABC transporter permease subunit [Pseudonocardia eucalypti]|uniref:ABC transporter permease subunit n=1 Tax=Pseudonocardia eucalypti TaxID=648755 RepID=A0ABP9Q5R8_9PSEU|nr:osmoprotectant transport system permease protein [Pseudonocardia eucalypti]